MRNTKRGLLIISILLAAVLVALCGTAIYLNSIESTMPQGEAAQKVWKYAKENGLRYLDYPQSLIDLLERNHETEQFVLEYPTAGKEVAAVDMTEYFGTETVPLFLQWDQRWGYLKYGDDVAGLTACGPVCLSMAAFYVTQDVSMSPANIIRFAAENGYYVKGSGSSWSLISQGGPQLGLTVTEIPLVENLIFRNLEAGVPIICAMGPGAFTTTGHFIVLTGCEDGMIRVNDPNSRKNSEKLWTYEEIAGDVRNLWTIEA